MYVIHQYYSDHDITAQLSEVGATEASQSPSLSKMLTGQNEEGGEPEDEDTVLSASPSLKSPKELAAIASSADFSKRISKSADLKALLPTQKMRFMKVTICTVFFLDPTCIIVSHCIELYCICPQLSLAG